MNILVLGASGMLGNAVFNTLSADAQLTVTGTLRSAALAEHFAQPLRARLVSGVDVLDHDTLVATMAAHRPDVVINCIGLIKQLAQANNPLHALPINAMFPHRLAALAQLGSTRVVHVSTDCVFSGQRGGYREDDGADAQDLYGRSKHIGELSQYPHAITLRTSIIGHELASAHALVDWFLGQGDETRGFTRAVFSGLPTVELASVIQHHVLPNPELQGLYHVSAKAINKYDLLSMVRDTYQRPTRLIADDTLVIDRSLDSSRFCAATGYHAPAWPELVARMYADYSRRPAGAASRN